MLYPLFAMFLLTMSVFLANLYLRVRAVKNGTVSMTYFKTFEGPSTNRQLDQFSNHIRNLFEMPVLFYVVSLAVMVLNRVDDLFINLGWMYCLTRLIHSYIHLTYNKVPHRLAAFMASNIVLVVMWVRLVV
jgi:hypothetical protein